MMSQNMRSRSSSVSSSQCFWARSATRLAAAFCSGRLAVFGGLPPEFRAAEPDRKLHWRQEPKPPREQGHKLLGPLVARAWQRIPGQHRPIADAAHCWVLLRRLWEVYSRENDTTSAFRWVFKQAVCLSGSYPCLRLLHPRAQPFLPAKKFTCCATHARCNLLRTLVAFGGCRVRAADLFPPGSAKPDRCLAEVGLHELH